MTGTRIEGDPNKCDPCPHCGNSDSVHSEVFPHPDTWAVICENCLMRGPTKLAAVEQEVIRWWNNLPRRHVDHHALPAFEVGAHVTTPRSIV